MLAWKVNQKLNFIQVLNKYKYQKKNTYDRRVLVYIVFCKNKNG